MFTYTLNEETYYVSGDRLYVPLEGKHELDEIDDHPIHLYESEDYRKYLVRLEWGGSPFSSVKIESLDDRGPPQRYVDAEEFTFATPVRPIVPEEINECPKCGSWAGTGDHPSCLSCGYGIETEDENQPENHA